MSPQESQSCFLKSFDFDEHELHPVSQLPISQESQSCFLKSFDLVEHELQPVSQLLQFPMPVVAHPVADRANPSSRL
jgi:hypothetical protein